MQVFACFSTLLLWTWLFPLQKQIYLVTWTHQVSDQVLCQPYRYNFWYWWELADICILVSAIRISGLVFWVLVSSISIFINWGYLYKYLCGSSTGYRYWWNTISWYLLTDECQSILVTKYCLPVNCYLLLGNIYLYMHNILHRLCT